MSSHFRRDRANQARRVRARRVWPRGVRLSAAAAATIPLLAAVPAGAQTEPRDQRWFRGNTHAHTLNSDGNASPAEVAQWYRDHGYAFVVITDHETVTEIAELNRDFGIAGKFIVLPGQEITQRVADSSRASSPRQAHVVAIGIQHAILPLGERGLASGVSVAATLERNIAAIREAGGVAQVNHPNFRWSLRPQDLMTVPDSTLFELWNAQPRINNLGGDDGAGGVALSTEALWDTLLTRGLLLYGVASDDAHKFRGQQLDAPEAAWPGGGWVMVRADTLTADAIMAALRSGAFYSSTGVALEHYEAGPSQVLLRIATSGGRDERRFLTRFIGRGGSVLAAVPGTTASYELRGDEGYVRAVVSDSNGRQAWTQPFYIRAH